MGRPLKNKNQFWLITTTARVQQMGLYFNRRGMQSRAYSLTKPENQTRETNRYARQAWVSLPKSWCEARYDFLNEVNYSIPLKKRTVRVVANGREIVRYATIHMSRRYWNTHNIPGRKLEQIPNQTAFFMFHYPFVKCPCSPLSYKPEDLEYQSFHHYDASNLYGNRVDRFDELNFPVIKNTDWPDIWCTLPFLKLWYSPRKNQEMPKWCNRARKIIKLSDSTDLMLDYILRNGSTWITCLWESDSSSDDGNDSE